MTRSQRRLYKRILSILETKNGVFLTLTFNDAFLNHTNAETRKRYIKEYLNKYTDEYILNVDYGKAKNREHYHAIAYTTLNNGKINLRAYKYGNIQADFINLNWRRTKGADTTKETAFYLMEHALKETTNKKVIYSRTKQKRRIIRYQKDGSAKIL